MKAMSKRRVHKQFEAAFRAWLVQTLQTLEHNQETMMSKLDDLQAAVANTQTVEASAVALLNGLKTDLDAAVAAGNMDQVAAITTNLGNSTAALAAAVAADSPQAAAAAVAAMPAQVAVPGAAT